MALTFAGKTTDGRPVIDGALSLMETHGVPLDMIVDHIYGHGAVIDWAAFVDAALKRRWRLSTALAKIHESVTDSLGSRQADVITRRARQYVTEPGEA